MNKIDILNEIKDFLSSNIGDMYYSFACRSFVFHFNNSKYDLMSIYINEKQDVIIECVGYSPFKLNYINIEDLSFKTLHKIYTNLVADFIVNNQVYN